MQESRHVSARTNFGARLRQAREQRGLTLRDIAATTKISVSALDALERGDASRLPGGIYARAFVRSYSTEIGVDPEATVREFLELFPSETNPVRNPMPVGAAAGTRRDRPSGRLPLAGVVLAAAAGTAFVLMGWVPAGWMRLAQPGSQVAEARLPEPPPAPAPPVAAPPQLPSAAGAPDSASLPGPVTTTAVEPAPVLDVAQVAQSELLRLVVQPTARCWVHIVADGAVVFAREMSAGEREVREARASFVVTVGNAAAFAYTINDAPGRPLGGEGKVVRVRIDRASLPELVAE
jgi:cytoskeleton protein RodZ